MKLIIAEKPSVAAAIAAVLGVQGKKAGYIEGKGCLISWRDFDSKKQSKEVCI